MLSKKIFFKLMNNAVFGKNTRKIEKENNSQTHNQ